MQSFKIASITAGLFCQSKTILLFTCGNALHRSPPSWNNDNERRSSACLDGPQTWTLERCWNNHNWIQVTVTQHSQKHEKKKQNKLESHLASVMEVRNKIMKSETADWLQSSQVERWRVQALSNHGSEGFHLEKRNNCVQRRNDTVVQMQSSTVLHGLLKQHHTVWTFRHSKTDLV